jgi:olefin beta-lactone synthetase
MKAIFRKIVAKSINLVYLENMHSWVRGFNPLNLLSTFLETTARQSDVTAIVSPNGNAISYADLALLSCSLAAAWRNKGIEKGDRILLAMPVGIELYAAIAGLWRLGATIVFPEPAMGFSGLRHAVQIAKPKAILTSGYYRLLPYLAPVLWGINKRLYLNEDTAGPDIFEDVENDHPALISFTSGSSGLPKGIIRSHGFLSAQNTCVADMLRSDNVHEIDLVAFPVFVIANLAMGVTSVLPNWKLSQHDRVEARDIIRLIADQKVTRALIPPSICDTLSKGQEDPGLQTIFTGGGPIFPDLMRSMQIRMPNTIVMAVYGSTEAEPIAHQLIRDISTEDWAAMDSGAGLLAGAPVAQTQTRIMDDEIIVTGDHVNKSYLDGCGDEENKIIIDGQIWHRTGDAGRFDDRGRLWLRGRRIGEINGLFPFEIEVAARSWPGIHRAALFPYKGRAILAVSGDVQCIDIWQNKAWALGNIEIFNIKNIPLDKRHKSKVDYNQLNQIAQKLLH